LRTIFYSLLLIFVSCNTANKNAINNIERSIYYWKSNFKISAIEKDALQKQTIQTIFMKFFDVEWNEEIQSPAPIALLKITDTTFLQQQKTIVIPTIFITNESLFKLDSSKVAQLANDIFSLTKKMIANNGLQKLNEIQIDCDWTASTKNKYFTLLKVLQSFDKSLLYSVTIRLHQIKFMDKTGVPPVSRGMLMCYNMGNLTSLSTQNSILEIAELKKYIGKLQDYPLPLDVAYPLFDWKVLFIKATFKSIISSLDDRVFTKSVCTINGNRYTILKDTILDGIALQKDDIIRNEKVSYEDIITAASLIKTKFKHNNFRVSLYHLDTLTLKKFTANEMENIYSNMH
jgi:hypothetical protein